MTERFKNASEDERFALLVQSLLSLSFVNDIEEYDRALEKMDRSFKINFYGQKYYERYYANENWKENYILDRYWDYVRELNFSP